MTNAKSLIHSLNVTLCQALEVQLEKFPLLAREAVCIEIIMVE